MRESLKIMSTTRTAYTLSYFLTQALFTFVSALFVTIGMMWQFQNPAGIAGGWKVLLMNTVLFGFALIAFSMTLSTLFTDSKLSPQVGMYILLLPSSIYFFIMTNRIQLLGQKDESLAYQLFPLTYLVPNFSFSVIMLDFFIAKGPETLLNLNTNVAWYCLALATPFYLCAYMYLDGVIPNAFGIREHPLFCCKCLTSRRKQGEPRHESDLEEDPLAVEL